MNTTQQKIRIAHLVKDRDFQVRGKIDEGTVRRYANAMKAGAQFPPITVVNTEGMNLLVDGWHRVAALESLNAWDVDAVVHTAPKREAYWMAAEANLKHGLPLKTRELRRVFKAFVASGQNSKQKGHLMSYRDIGREIGVSHNTIRNWMIEFFPHIARAMGGQEHLSSGDALTEDLYPLGPVRDAMIALEKVVTVFQTMSDPKARGTVIREARQMLHTLETSGGWNTDHIMDI